MQVHSSDPMTFDPKVRLRLRSTPTFKFDPYSGDIRGDPEVKGHRVFILTFKDCIFYASFLANYLPLASHIKYVTLREEIKLI